MSESFIKNCFQKFHTTKLSIVFSLECSSYSKGFLKLNPFQHGVNIPKIALILLSIDRNTSFIFSNFIHLSSVPVKMLRICLVLMLRRLFKLTSRRGFTYYLSFVFPYSSRFHRKKIDIILPFPFLSSLIIIISAKCFILGIKTISSIVAKLIQIIYKIYVQIIKG